MLFFEHKHLYRRIKGEVPEERYTTPIGKARIHRAGDDITVVTWGAMVYTAEEAAAAARATRLGRDHRPAHGHAVGQGGGARLGAQDVEGARPARGHAHRRLRRRDRGDDRRGGVRGSRRAAEAAHGARHARAVLAGARGGVHAAGRRRRRRRCASSASTRGADGHRNRRRCRDAADGRLRVGGDGHALAQAASATRSRPTSRCSRSRPTRSTPRCRARERDVLQEILVQEGETVDVGTTLGADRRRRGCDRGAEPAAPLPAAAEPEPSRPSRRPSRSRLPSRRRPRPQRRAAQPRRPRRQRPRRGTAQRSSPRSSRGSPPSTGSTRGQVTGTGRGGRVTKKDILAFVESGGTAAAAAPAAPAPSRSGSGCRTRRPPLRRAAAAPAPPAPRRAAAPRAARGRRDASSR